MVGRTGLDESLKSRLGQKQRKESKRLTNIPVVNAAILFLIKTLALMIAHYFKPTMSNSKINLPFSLKDRRPQIETELETRTGFTPEITRGFRG